MIYSYKLDLGTAGEVYPPAQASIVNKVSGLQALVYGGNDVKPRG